MLAQLERPIRLGDVIDLQARQAPHKVAVQAVDGTLTYEELRARGAQVARGLEAAGIGAGGRVAVLVRNSTVFLEMLSGVLQARAVLLPLNWRLAAPELRYILEHGQAQALIYDAEFRNAATEAAERLATLELRLEIGAEGPNDYRTWRDRRSASPKRNEAAPDEVFVQMYTSGTTGLPKGVQLTHANYDACFTAMDTQPWNRGSAQDVAFAPAPFFHVNGLNMILRSLGWGARLVTVDQFRASEVVEIFERERVTRAALAPAMMQMCLEAPGVGERDFSALRLITYGGSPITETVLKRSRQVFSCAFAQGYGMTEATGPVTMLAPEDHASDDHLTSCGRPLPGVGVKVVRPDGSTCENGEVGEVVVKGPMVTLGYWRDSEATARTIVDGWLFTGDAGYFDGAGFLHIHDRVKEMIVSGGENVYPAEVENALAKHPDVADVAVIGIPHPVWGEAVKALVVLREGAAADEDAIIGGTRAHIAGYKLPKSITFVDSLPRNPAGKILRRELRAPYWANEARRVN